MKNIKLFILLLALGSIPTFLTAEDEAPAEESSEESTEASPAAAPVISSGPQMPMTPVMETRPHAYTGYKQNSYCVKCGKYTFHWHGSSPNNPDLYPNYECKDCGFVRKIKIA